jgi:hypothetical protein
MLRSGSSSALFVGRVGEHSTSRARVRLDMPIAKFFGILKEPPRPGPFRCRGFSPRVQGAEIIWRCFSAALIARSATSHLVSVDSRSQPQSRCGSAAVGATSRRGGGRYMERLEESGKSFSDLFR